MSPVHIHEPNPETRAKVLRQISGTEGVTTALATVEPKKSSRRRIPSTVTRRTLPNMPNLFLEFCSSGDKRYKEIRARHYVDSRGTQGQQVHFLIWYRMIGEADHKVVGIISGASAVYRNKARDAFFGITDANRDRVLNGIISNTAFRLEVHPTRPDRHGRQRGFLASEVLAMFRRVAAHCWEEIYGVKVYGFETFVDTGTGGGCYRADNWTRVQGGEKS